MTIYRSKYRIPRNFTRLSTCRSFANFSHSGLRIPSPTKITLYGSGKNCTALITVSWSFSCLNAATIVINLQSSVIARVFLEIGWLSANFWILIPLYIVNTGRLMMMDFSRFSVVAGDIDNNILIFTIHPTVERFKPRPISSAITCTMFSSDEIYLMK